MHPIAPNPSTLFDRELTEDEQDRLFHALADATRRDILRRCLGAEPSVSELARNYPISIAAIQKHVGVLEGAGLVTRERRGREQLVHTHLPAFDQARYALSRLEAAWRGRINRMASVLDEGMDAVDTEGSTR